MMLLALACLLACLLSLQCKPQTLWISDATLQIIAMACSVEKTSWQLISNAALRKVVGGSFKKRSLGTCPKNCARRIPHEKRSFPLIWRMGAMSPSRLWPKCRRTRATPSRRRRAGSQVLTCPAPAPPTRQMLLEMLDDVHLVGELRHPVPTFQDVLVFLRAGARRALERSLMALLDAHVGSPDDVRRSRAWKVFLLTPRMLLARAKLKGAAGRRELLQRIQSHGQRQWQALLADVRDASC